MRKVERSRTKNKQKKKESIRHASKDSKIRSSEPLNTPRETREKAEWNMVTTKGTREAKKQRIVIWNQKRKSKG